MYHRFEIVIVVAFAALAVWFVWTKLREARRYRAERRSGTGTAPDEA